MNRMNQQKKAAALLGTVLSLLAVVLVIMSFFSLIAKRAQGKEEETKQPQSSTQQQMQQNTKNSAGAGLESATLPQKEKTPQAAEKPAEEKTPSSAAQNETARPSSVEQMRFYLPIAGASVSKSFSDTVATFSMTMNDYRTHTGVDLYAPVGTNVVACADGTVKEIVNDPFCGWCVTLSHDADVESRYCNLAEGIPASLAVGSEVKAGDVIGGVGESMITEIADATHLHFEMTVDGKAVDPMQYCPTAQSAMAQAEE